MIVNGKGRGVRSSEESAVPLLFPHTAGGLTGSSTLRLLLLLVISIILDNNVDSFCEDLCDTSHFLATALHISRSHLLRYCHSLLLCDRCQTLCLEELDAGSFCSKV